MTHHYDLRLDHIVLKNMFLRQAQGQKSFTGSYPVNIQIFLDIHTVIAPDIVRYLSGVRRFKIDQFYS